MLQLDRHQLMNSFRPDLTDMVKFCSWKDKNCLREDLWDIIITRNGLCFELTTPSRLVSRSDERLKLIFGTFFTQVENPKKIKYVRPDKRWTHQGDSEILNMNAWKSGERMKVSDFLSETVWTYLIFVWDSGWEHFVRSVLERAGLFPQCSVLLESQPIFVVVFFLRVNRRQQMIIKFLCFPPYFLLSMKWLLMS